ncbi:serine/arginine repetitive matrix protein 2-like isoform X3 [Biomphalaria glabrata]|uniref:Serine/arginine repetitive matrix protein 2-like isoform X3 n=1 Tax=Biomphalaria glabrata TaxID=6526 RepID=A0A9W2YJ74_BIOGL|nr:serine/arginine repetitive matrix protein 2-like isoform X3 [Biomphalaria glabrata]XP_055862773.1 serine/arginine repetitive matrix protein 2-like isoform X3 [Biomphalaria glabrata]
MSYASKKVTKTKNVLLLRKLSEASCIQCCGCHCHCCAKHQSKNCLMDMCPRKVFSPSIKPKSVFDFFYDQLYSDRKDIKLCLRCGQRFEERSLDALFVSDVYSSSVDRQLCRACLNKSLDKEDEDLKDYVRPKQDICFEDEALPCYGLPLGCFQIYLAKETHQLAEANQEKNARLKEAFGLTDYVDGSAFDPDRKAKEEAAKAAAMAQKKYSLLASSGEEEGKEEGGSSSHKKKKKRSRHDSTSPEKSKEKKKKSRKHSKRDRSHSKKTKKSKHSKKRSSRKRKHKKYSSSSSSETDSDDAEIDRQEKDQTVIPLTNKTNGIHNSPSTSLASPVLRKDCSPHVLSDSLPTPLEVKSSPISSPLVESIKPLNDESSASRLKSKIRDSKLSTSRSRSRSRSYRSHSFRRSLKRSSSRSSSSRSRTRSRSGSHSHSTHHHSRSISYSRSRSRSHRSSSHSECRGSRGNSRSSSVKRRHGSPRSPSIRRRHGSPSHLDKRRITRSRSPVRWYHKRHSYSRSRSRSSSKPSLLTRNNVYRAHY